MAMKFLSVCPMAYGAARQCSKGLLATLLISGAAWAEPVTIAALGDSLTQGYGLAQGAGFVPQLETWLQDAGADVRVLNAGVSGDTTAGGLARVDWTLTDDVDAMIVALGGNDLLRGIDPANSRANLEGIMAAAAAREVPVLLIGMQAPGNFGADYKQAFDRIYPDLSNDYGAIYVENFLGALLGPDDDPSEIAEFIQPDGIHPNAAGVQRIVAAIGPEALKLVAQTGAPSPAN